MFKESSLYFHLSLDEMLEKISSLRLEAVEISTGGYGSPKHIPVADILNDPAKSESMEEKVRRKKYQSSGAQHVWKSHSSEPRHRAAVRRLVLPDRAAG